MIKELKMGTGNYKHKPHSEETKRKIGLSRKGIKHTEESKLKMGHSNEEHYKWKDDEANNNVLHVWVAKNKPKPKKCEECGHIRKLNLASLTNHNYTRNIEDYKWLCYSCHKKLDMKCKCCGETNKKMHLFMICSDCKEDGFVNIRLLKDKGRTKMPDETGNYCYLLSEEEINNLAGKELI